MDNVSQSMLSVLVRAYQSKKLKLPASKAAHYFVQECGFGSIIGSNWHLEERDLRAIRSYLAEHHGISSPDSVDFSFVGKNRVQAAAVSPKEKFAGAGPHDGYVLVRSKSGAVKLNGMQHASFGRSCLYVDVREVKSIEHDCVVVVENFEAAKQFEDLKLINFPYGDPLVVFRGDATFPSNGARVLAETASVPVIAWTDLDPQGVNIAASTPHVYGAIFPVDFSALTRTDLYDKQRQMMKSLEAYPAGWLKPIAAMKDVHSAMTQETMIARGVHCELFEIHPRN